jgi:hypothetical protein
MRKFMIITVAVLALGALAGVKTAPAQQTQVHICCGIPMCPGSPMCPVTAADKQK